MILILEKNLGGGISAVMDDRHVESGEIKKLLYFDATNLYGHSVSQPLPYDVVEFWHGQPDLYMNKLEKTLNTPEESDVGYFVEIDLRYPDKIKKTKNSPFAPENKVLHKDKYNDYMTKIKPKYHTKAKKLICDWSDQNNYLILYKMVKFNVRHGMIEDKNHEISSFKQSKWLEKNVNHNPQKRINSKKDFEKHFHFLLNNKFYGKTTEKVKSCFKIY